MADPKKEDDDLELTTINERLVELPDESIINVDVSDNPDLAAQEEEDDDTGTVVQQPKSEPKKPDAGESETLTALRKQIEDNNKATQERIRAAEQTAQSERNARLEAERRSQEREAQSQEEISQRELAIVTQGIESNQSQLETLENELARLNEEGNHREAAKVQSKIARVAATLDRLEATKAEIEVNPKKPPVHEGRVTQKPALDQYYDNMAPASANWIRAHPECLPPELGGRTDANNKMLAGHYAAIAKGFQPNTEDYFRVIEETTGHRQVEAPKTEVKNENNGAEGGVNANGGAKTPPAGKKSPQRKAIPSAPPSGDVPGGPRIPSTTRQVLLTKEQQEAALLSFPHLKPNEALAQYARNLIELEAEGKMGRTSH